MMTTTAEKSTESVTNILNGTIQSVRSVIPLNIDIGKPQLYEKPLELEFGVLIGITGEIKGSLVLAGSAPLFGSIGESMYGMSLEGEMLSSFSGELGNMIAGGMSTNAEESGTHTDITSPTIMEGNTSLKGFRKGLQIPILINESEKFTIYLLLDS
ncbi:chemotaxis protein CheX [Virgibacillus sp. MSP4-1]|uniref:chemotaxis protein CheX n=1 Tax=Virgibacillus sp. MSP4-1 TaxID=2700081 RepID=UPI00351B80B0